MTACGLSSKFAPPTPDDTTFVYFGHEDKDEIELLEYPETGVEIPTISDLQDRIRVDSAPTEKTLVVNGNEYRLEYEDSYRRAREAFFTHSYVLKTEDYRVSASYTETGETPVFLSFSEFADADSKQIKDLSEKGESYFRSLAEQIIKTYCNADATEYRVHCTTRQDTTTPNGWSNPEYDGFVPEPQKKNAVDCLKHYQFFFVKYAKDMPTQEYIRVELRQDGCLELLVSWFPGSMDGHPDYAVSPEAVENAAREFIETHYKSDLFTLDLCEIKGVTLCLDEERNPFYRVDALLKATRISQGVTVSTLETLYFKPLSERE